MAGLLEQTSLADYATGLAADPARPRLWIGLATPDIVRMDLDGSQPVTFSAGLTGAPSSMTAAPDGNVWFATTSHRVGRVTPDGRITEFNTGVLVSGQPKSLTSGPGAAVWFVNGHGLERVALDPPAITTRNATGVSTRDATLSTSVAPRDAATSVHFEYGPTTAYGSRTPSVAIGDGDDPVPLEAHIDGLSPATTIHFRAVATSPVGTTSGPDQTLTTAAEPVVRPIIAPADTDADGDGVPAPVDCDDHDAGVHAGARDIPGDGIDQDCNGRDAAYPRFAPRTVANWDVYGHAFAIFNSLLVENVPKGTRIELSCEGGGCRLSHWSTTVRRTTRRLNLLTKLRHSRLRHGSRVQLRLIRPDAIGALHVWRIGPPPHETVGCLVPGKSKERKC